MAIFNENGKVRSWLIGAMTSSPCGTESAPVYSLLVTGLIFGIADTNWEHKVILHIDDDEGGFEGRGGHGALFVGQRLCDVHCEVRAWWCGLGNGGVARDEYIREFQEATKTTQKSKLQRHI